MARKYSKAASRKVEKVMKERKRGTLKSGRSGLATFDAPAFLSDNCEVYFVFSSI